MDEREFSGGHDKVKQHCAETPVYLALFQLWLVGIEQNIPASASNPAK